MKKVLLMVLFFAVAGFLFCDDFHFFTSSELNQLWGPAPGVRETPVSALVNPAYVATQNHNYNELEVLFSNTGINSMDPEGLGFFFANHIFNAGLLYSILPGDHVQYDYNFGLGFGNRAFSMGFTNGGYYNGNSGDSAFFGSYRVGTLVRPGDFLSIGVGVGGTYDLNWTDFNTELALRPFRKSLNNLLTLFGTYSLTFHDDDYDHNWSAGLVLKPVRGLGIQAAYSSLKTVTLGFSMAFSGLGIGFTTLAEQDFSSLDSYSLELRLSRNNKDPVIIVEPNMYVELNLKNTSGFWGRPVDLLQTLMVIDKAKSDERVKGIILNTSGFSSDREVMWEIRRALENFKASGKLVIAFTDNPDFDTYTLISVADKIVMDPSGMVSFLGLSVGRNYFKNTLDKLGIGVTELRYFTYKSAAESYTRDSFSQADREQYTAYLDDIFGYSKEAIIKARSWSEADFDRIINREFFYSAQDAKSRGLVDYIGRKDEIRNVIENQDRKLYWTPVFGDTKNSLMAGGFGSFEYDYQALPADTWGEPPHIAIVNVNGPTDLDTGIAARTLSKVIQSLAAAPNVEAIVLRVNSPGGSAIAADYIDEAVKFAKTRKPVVVSMGPVAGSGGYWLCMSADHIVASPYTLTGSIGVIGTWFYNKGIFEKVGITTDSIQQGDHADLMNGFILPYRNLNEEEQARYKEYILESYNQFVQKVARSRKLPLGKVEALAQGRVYSGTAAKELGLVDSIGSLWDAITVARSLAGIPDYKEVVFDEYPVKTPWDYFISGMTNWIIPSRGKIPAVEELKYRMSQNGLVMPIMSLDVIE